MAHRKYSLRCAQEWRAQTQIPAWAVGFIELLSDQWQGKRSICRGSLRHTCRLQMLSRGQQLLLLSVSYCSCACTMIIHTPAVCCEPATSMRPHRGTFRAIIPPAFWMHLLPLLRPCRCKKTRNHRSRQPRRERASALQGAGAEGQHRATPTRAAAPEAPPLGSNSCFYVFAILV